ncbi:helix-turn-helix transcriptional regulator [Streptomyces sp. NPDC005925]|uniref:helix-turn-helix transcriptional regulator n=1 Tax=Streptomyces sp. NPDC005925 TaxID=3157172 RepID=UPI0033E2014C
MESLAAVHLMECERTDESGDVPGERWRALNPQAAAARLTATETRLRQLMVALRDSRQSLDDLFDVYAARTSGPAAAIPVEVVDSPAETAPLINKAFASCRSEVLAARPGGPDGELVPHNEQLHDLELLDRGVRLKVLYRNSAPNRVTTRVHAERLTAAGGEVRTSTELFGGLLVFDRSLAFVPHRTIPGAATLVHDPSLVTYMCAAFDHAWGLARRFGGAPQTTREFTEVQLQVMRLLSEGARDETMARRLGVSLRTCRKYVADIFERLGAESRFQAGFLIGRRGVIK